jgi:hypothetical protein
MVRVSAVCWPKCSIYHLGLAAKFELNGTTATISREIGEGEELCK